MAQGKCSLLKPVNNLTGTFFLFSQYAQDLTKQYSNPDSYRCVPSKFVAMDLDFNGIKIENGTEEEFKKKFYSERLGNIFQNYFENSCTFLRNKYGDEWDPEFSRTLLFQTLEKYNLIGVKNIKDSNGSIIEGSGISKNVQYIGDIDIYSYNDNADGVGYNEIYCYIPNSAKCVDYDMDMVDYDTNTFDYLSNQICGYNEDSISYNGLTYNVIDGHDVYIDSNSKSNFYSLGRYVNSNYEECITFVPSLLNNYIAKNEENYRITDVDGKILEKFNINAILVLYDIVSKSKTDDVLKEETIYRNIPLGIYFTGCLDGDCIMSNQIVKYVNSEQIYNQGTSYGLRICNRFISNPLSTEIISTETTGSSNVSEIAPVLEKIGEVLLESEEVIKSNDDIRSLLYGHLSQFKNNKVNVPYVRELGKKKYWFVNGKNTGAIAQDETTSQEDLKEEIILEISDKVYTKEQVNNINVLKNYYTKAYIDDILGESGDNKNAIATKAYVDEKIEQIMNILKIS